VDLYLRICLNEAKTMFTRFLCGVALAALFVSGASANDLPTVLINTDKAKVTLVFDRALPNVPGKSMKGVLVEYQPSGSNPAHTHPASAFIYAAVLEGAIRSKINDGPEKVYHAGKSWTEVAGDHHFVSANASDSQPARLLAVFVVDTDEKNLITPDKE
jgi:quercetin dioxygenase-like cupin family protein